MVGGQEGGDQLGRSRATIWTSSVCRLNRPHAKVCAPPLVFVVFVIVVDIVVVVVVPPPPPPPAD